MCMVCFEYVKGRLTKEEAKRNLMELAVILEGDHVEEAEKLIAETSPDPFEQL